MNKFNSLSEAAAVVASRDIMRNYQDMARLSSLSGSVLATVSRDITRNYPNTASLNCLPGSVFETIINRDITRNYPNTANLGRLSGAFLAATSRDITHNYPNTASLNCLSGSVFETIISRDITRNYPNAANLGRLSGAFLAAASRDITRNYWDTASLNSLSGSVFETIISRDITRNYPNTANLGRLSGAFLAAASRDITRNYRNMTRLSNLSRAADAITQSFRQNPLETLCWNIGRERCQLKQITETFSSVQGSYKENRLNQIFSSPLNSMSGYSKRIQIKRNYDFINCLPKSISVTEEINDQLQERLSAIGYETTRKELYQADVAIERKDYTGAIQHVLAALECMAREVTGNRTATLGKIIDIYPNLFPKPLNKVINGVWGYASQHGRHLREGGDPRFHEAQFVVRICKDAAIYLLRLVK